MESLENRQLLAADVADLVYSEGFENLNPSGDDLLDVSGWTGSPMALKSADRDLSGNVLDGTQRLPGVAFATATRTMDLSTDAPRLVVSFDAFASAGDAGFYSHNSGAGLNGLSWWSNDLHYQGWVLDARGVTGNSDAVALVEGQGYDVPVTMSVVVDHETREVFGRYDVGDGVHETERFAVTETQIAGLDQLYIAQDWRSGSGGNKLDNLEVIGEHDPPEPGVLRGSVWNDVNRDSNRDGFESAPESAMTVYVDLNQNGQLDADEPSQPTDADGEYEIGNVAPGHHLIGIELPEGWLLSRGRQNVTIESGGISNHTSKVYDSHVIMVNTNRDYVDLTPLGDGLVDANPGFPGQQISLRAAIMEANASPGTDTIILSPEVYQFARTGVCDDRALTGDLDVRDDLVIRGHHAVIDAAQMSMEMQKNSPAEAGRVSQSCLTIQVCARSTILARSSKSCRPKLVDSFH
jgi:hypothetical protein